MTPYLDLFVRRTVRTMGEVKKDDEVAAETWDDEGGHLASRRRGTVRDNSD